MCGSEQSTLTIRLPTPTSNGIPQVTRPGAYTRSLPAACPDHARVRPAAYSAGSAILLHGRHQHDRHARPPRVRSRARMHGPAAARARSQAVLPLSRRGLLGPHLAKRVHQLVVHARWPAALGDGATWHSRAGGAAAGAARGVPCLIFTSLRHISACGAAASGAPNAGASDDPTRRWLRCWCAWRLVS